MDIHLTHNKRWKFGLPIPPSEKYEPPLEMDYIMIEKNFGSSKNKPKEYKQIKKTY